MKTKEESWKAAVSCPVWKKCSVKCFPSGPLCNFKLFICYVSTLTWQWVGMFVHIDPCPFWVCSVKKNINIYFETCLFSHGLPKTIWYTCNLPSQSSWKLLFDLYRVRKKIQSTSNSWGSDQETFSPSFTKSHMFQLFPKAIRGKYGLAKLKQRFCSILIPEQCSKPLQPFHGMTWLGDLTPSSNDSFECSEHGSIRCPVFIHPPTSDICFF